MTDETEDLSRTLVWACGMILQAEPDDRQRIARAYQQAHELIAGIPLDNGDARPRIVACFHRSDAYKAADDIACVGWILTAIEVRVNEKNLPEWQKLRKIVNDAIKLLSPDEPTVH